MDRANAHDADAGRKKEGWEMPVKCKRGKERGAQKRQPDSTDRAAKPHLHSAGNGSRAALSRLGSDGDEASIRSRLLAEPMRVAPPPGWEKSCRQ